MNSNYQTIRRDQRGVAHVLFVVLALLAVAGIGGVAYWRISSYTNKSGANANGQTANDGSGDNSATQSDACVAATHDDNICHLGAISGPDKYASVVNITTKTDSGSQTWVEKFDGKGNSLVQSDGVNGITVGGHTYVMLGDQWVDVGGDNSQSPQAPAAPVIATTAGIKYENLGKVSCGNTTCYHYRCSGGILGDGVILVNFGTKDYLPRRYETTGGLTGDMTMDITYQAVTITAPAGAKTIQEYTSSLAG